MGENIPVPQTIALFDCGEAKGNIDFELFRDENGVIEGHGEDNLNDYFARPAADVECNGTLIVRNKKTGELKAIPVSKFLEISRESKINEFTKQERADTAALVNQFGTRQAKRIYNLRQSSGK